MSFRFNKNEEPPSVSDENWTRKPFSRSQLDELGRVTVDMSEEEVSRRMKATKFPGYSEPMLRLILNLK